LVWLITLFLLGGDDFDDGFRQQHHWDTEEGYAEDNELNGVLGGLVGFPPHRTIPIWFVPSFAHCESDIHHGLDDGGCPLSIAISLDIPIFEPLDNNKKIHIAKE
jgi:hypothetical protein